MTSFARSNCSQACRSLPFNCDAGMMNWPRALRVTTLSASVPLAPPAPTLGGVVNVSSKLILTCGISVFLCCYKVKKLNQIKPDGFPLRILLEFGSPRVRKMLALNRRPHLLDHFA